MIYEIIYNYKLIQHFIVIKISGFLNLFFMMIMTSEDDNYFEDNLTITF
jgi:hypothetical protein